MLKEHEAVMCQAGPAFTESHDFCPGTQTESTVSIARPCLGTKNMQSWGVVDRFPQLALTGVAIWGQFQISLVLYHGRESLRKHFLAAKVPTRLSNDTLLTHLPEAGYAEQVRERGIWGPNGVTALSSADLSAVG